MADTHNATLVEPSRLRFEPVRARLGLILSSGNRVVEGQLRAFAPPALAVHVTRMRMSEGRTRKLQDQIGVVLRASELVADANVDLIVLQASAFAMEKGPDAEAAVIQAIARETNIPALTSTQAMVQAAKSLGMKRLVVLSPSPQATNDEEKAYLQAVGFDVLKAVGLSMPAGISLSMTPADWLDAVKANARADADGYFLSGSNTTVLESIDTIERGMGKPVVGSTQATLWGSLRRLAPQLGDVTLPTGLGRLFALTRTDNLSADSITRGLT